mmetsp:Transcript_12468/g.41057  ORF Transcript_12468/g.41057 Transcript_12468/m.41057 type:complete len:217 (+) Transcript_12468:865-1515(+)
MRRMTCARSIPSKRLCAGSGTSRERRRARPGRSRRGQKHTHSSHRAPEGSSPFLSTTLDGSPRSAYLYRASLSCPQRRTRKSHAYGSQSAIWRWKCRKRRRSLTRRRGRRKASSWVCTKRWWRASVARVARCESDSSRISSSPAEARTPAASLQRLRNTSSPKFLTVRTRKQSRCLRTMRSGHRRTCRGTEESRWRSWTPRAIAGSSARSGWRASS